MKQFISRNVLSRLFPLVNKLNGINLQNTIIIAGAPRSGTTWLSEVLSSIPGYKFINEPLNLDSPYKPANYSYKWRTYINPDEIDNQLQKEYMSMIMQGKIDIGSLNNYNNISLVSKLKKHIGSKNLIIKFCRAGRLIHWFNNNFPTKAIFMIIRHPCAVISSMLRHGSWDNIEPEVCTAGLPEFLKDKCQNLMNGENSKVKVFAINWCLDYYVPFYLHNKNEEDVPWQLISYESLFLHKKEEVQNMFNYLHTELPRGIDKFLYKKSYSSSDSLNLEDTERQLGKWKFQLSTKQKNDIFSVLEQFELTFYNESIEPDYSSLAKFGLQS